jgi:hypothetical protein
MEAGKLQLLGRRQSALTPECLPTGVQLQLPPSTIFSAHDFRDITMKNNQDASPHIDGISWGRMEVTGIGTGKDFKLWPGGGREWDWRETGTHHVPGIQPIDIEELLDHGSRTIVLSRGMLLMLHTCRETLDLLEKRQIPVHIAETKAAVQIYNGLVADGEPVGGLFHSTC